MSQNFIKFFLWYFFPQRKLLIQKLHSALGFPLLQKPLRENDLRALSVKFISRYSLSPSVLYFNCSSKRRYRHNSSFYEHPVIRVRIPHLRAINGYKRNCGDTPFKNSNLLCISSTIYTHTYTHFTNSGNSA